MTRSIIAVLSQSMKTVIRRTERPLKAILTAFWSGTVKWDTAAQRQLNFWQSVDFMAFRAPISADVLGRSIELRFKYPGYMSDKDISVMVQDASNTAAGGGMVWREGNELKPAERIFLDVFNHKERQASSTLREITGILRCLRATEGSSKIKIIFACDNAQTVNAIKFGSRTVSIQQLAEEIFACSFRTNKICWSVWLPREHHLIQEADTRSRLVIPFDQRSTQKVVDRANRMTRRLWGKKLSINQTASHRSAVKVDGLRLPFNAFCWQPWASGVDTFLQHQSWIQNKNYVNPPKPMTGRMVTFLPYTRARSILVLPLPVGNAWWSYGITEEAHGLQA